MRSLRFGVPRNEHEVLQVAVLGYDTCSFPLGGTAIVAFTSTQPTATGCTGGLVNLCPMTFCQFKPMKIEACWGFGSDLSVVTGCLINHTRFKYAEGFLPSPKFVSFHRLFVLK